MSQFIEPALSRWNRAVSRKPAKKMLAPLSPFIEVMTLRKMDEPDYGASGIGEEAIGIFVNRGIDHTNHGSFYKNPLIYLI